MVIAKYIGARPEKVLALPWPEFTRFIRKHGFYLTGSGLIPWDYTKGAAQ